MFFQNLDYKTPLFDHLRQESWGQTPLLDKSHVASRRLQGHNSLFRWAEQSTPKWITSHSPQPARVCVPWAARSKRGAGLVYKQDAKPNSPQVIVRSRKTIVIPKSSSFHWSWPGRRFEATVPAGGPRHGDRPGMRPPEKKGGGKVGWPALLAGPLGRRRTRAVGPPRRLGPPGPTVSRPRERQSLWLLSQPGREE